MNQGKKITELEKAASVPDGSSYIVEMGDGTGTKRVLHEDMVKSVGSSLPLGETAELETRNRDNFVGAINELVRKMALGGIAYKGAYDPEAEYERLDAVFYEGSTFVAMKDGPEGPPTADVANWQYLAKGFMEGYLLAKSQLVNNLLATEPGNPLDAVQGKALADMISGINGNLGKEYIANSELISCVNGNSTSTGARLVVPAGVYAISASAVWENGTNNLNGNRRISVLRGDFYNAEAVTANDAAGCRSAQVQSCCGLFISSSSNVLRIFLLQNNTSSAEIAAKNIKLLAVKIK